VDEDATYDYHITIDDGNVEASLTVAAPQLPTWLTLTDKGDGTFDLSGTPTNSEVGSHDVLLEGSDGLAPAVQQGHLASLW